MAHLWHMRTTIEMPDDLLSRAKSAAALSRISLRAFFIEAVEEKLTATISSKPVKVRKAPPAIGGLDGATISPVSRELLDEAMFG